MTFVHVRNATLNLPMIMSPSESFKRKFIVDPISRMLPKNKYVGGSIGFEGKNLEVRALDDVSFDVNLSERVGIIGHNGAGKSTLLRLVAGIFEPTTGEVITQGKIITLLNLNEGLSNESSGREFIETRGFLLGLDASERLELIENVVEFSELGDYIDLPIRVYSTGMLVRLSFGIITAVQSDILLFDELIGAGDAAFQQKASERLAEFIEQSKIMFVATHNTEILKKWCTRCLLINHGKLIFDGPVMETLEYFEKNIIDQRL